MTANVSNDDKYVLVAPLKRKGTPQEVADAALFLSSSKATFIQGAGLVSLLQAFVETALANEL